MCAAITPSNLCCLGHYPLYLSNYPATICYRSGYNRNNINYKTHLEPNAKAFHLLALNGEVFNIRVYMREAHIQEILSCAHFATHI